MRKYEMITKFNTDYLAIPIIRVNTHTHTHTHTHRYTLLNKYTRMRVPIDAAPLVPAGTGGAAVFFIPNGTNNVKPLNIND